MANRKKCDPHLSDDELKWYAMAYIKNRFNNTETYMQFSAKFRNGCSVSTARSNGHRIMKQYRDEIYGYVEDLMKNEQESEIASAEEVLKFYSSVMRGNLTRKKYYACNDHLEERDEMPTVSESLKGADGLAKAYGMQKEKKEVEYGKNTLKTISDLSLKEKSQMVQDLLKEFGE
jgi:phage terminase small subunit